MVIAFPADVGDEAVAVYSQLTASERRILGFAAMQLVVARHRGGAR